MLYQENLDVKYTLLDNPRRFLFIFDLKTLAVNCCCGLPLRIGTQAIAGVFLFLALFQVICAIAGDEVYYIIFSILKVIVYLFVSIILISAVANQDTDKAYIGYITNIIVLIFNLLEGVLICILICVNNDRTINFGFVSVEYSQRLAVVVALLYLLFEFIQAFIHIYLIYIVFSYMIHLEKGNLNLINGYVPVLHNEIEMIKMTPGHNENEKK